MGFTLVVTKYCNKGTSRIMYSTVIIQTGSFQFNNNRRFSANVGNVFDRSEANLLHVQLYEFNWSVRVWIPVA